jgi:hypothetical protein
MPCESMVAVPTSKLMLPFRAVVPGTTAWVICCVVVVVGMGCSDPSSDDDDCPPWIGTEAYYESESDGNCMFVPECVEEEDEGPTDMSDLAPYSNPSHPPSGTSPPTGTPRPGSTTAGQVPSIDSRPSSSRKNTVGPRERRSLQLRTSWMR